MREPYLYNGLTEFAKENVARFCMPGHKGKSVGSFLDTVAAFDVTELSSTDNLWHPDGIIKKAEETAVEVFKSRFTCFSASGATPLVKAAVWLTAKGGKILSGREAHLSLTHAAALSGTELVWLPLTLSQYGVPEPPKPGEIEVKLKEDNTIRAVFVTSPNYYGVMADIGGISAVCKKFHVPLIVDNSHGSHLAFLDGGKKHPNALGAELVIDSAHKTLPALTGAALFHCNTEKITKEEAKEAILLFSSTSPSYLIMASLDYAVCLADSRREKFAEAALNAGRIKKELDGRGFTCLAGENLDPLRLTIVTSLSDVDAREANERLFEHGIACEMADVNCLVLILSPFDTWEQLLFLANSLDLYYNRRGTVRKKAVLPIALPKPEPVMGVREAFLAPKEKLPVEDAAGRICGECITAFPPCVPVAVTGELITKELAEFLKKEGKKEIAVIIEK